MTRRVHDLPLPRSGPYPHPFLPALLVAVALSAGACSTLAPSATDSSKSPDSHTLMAEIALQRRELPTAAEQFTLAAERSADVTLAERATQFTFGAGFDGWALRAARRWLELAPDNALAHEVMGRLRLRRREVDQAATEFLAALGTAEPLRDDIYLALGADLGREEDAATVTRVLSRLAGRDPLAPGLQLALGTAALRSNEPELALGAAESALLDDPEWLEARLLRARALLAAGDTDAALSSAQSLLGDKANLAVEVEYARILADAGRVGEARRRLEALPGAQATSAEVVRSLAILDLAAGDAESARRRFEELTTVASQRFEAFYYLGRIAAATGNDDDARRWYERVSSGTYLVPARLADAETYQRAGTPRQGAAELEQFAVDFPAQAFEVMQYRATLLEAAGAADEAAGVLDAAGRYKPDDVPLLTARGALRERLGNIDGALADMRRAAELAPDDATVLNAYGYTLANRTRKAREAWPLIRRAVEIEPDNAAVQDSVGWVLTKLGRYEESRSWLEQAWGSLPDPEIASHLADVLVRLGERDRAFAVLYTTLMISPDSDMAADAMRQLDR